MLVSLKHNDVLTHSLKKIKQRLDGIIHSQKLFILAKTGKKNRMDRIKTRKIV